MQTVYFGITCVRIASFIILAIAFLFEVGLKSSSYLPHFEEEVLRHYALLSGINLEMIFCNKKELEVVENFESDGPKSSIHHQADFQTCRANSQIVGWILCMPFLCFQMYHAFHFRHVRNNISQMDTSKNTVCFKKKLFDESGKAPLFK